MKAKGAVLVRELMALAVGAALAVSAGCGGSSPEKCGAVSPQCTAMATNDCNKCVGSCCCSQTMACIGNSSCMSLTECVNSCSSSDNVCITNCMTTYSGATSLLLDVGTCVNANCSSVCQ